MSSSGNYNDEDSDISIRGIDSTAGASTTGIYVDDTPIQTRHLNFGTVNPYPALFDLDRVEVLKGPQGTLFGAGSEGGTIRFITPEPSLDDLLGLRARGVRQNRRRRPELRGGCRVRRPDHRRRARLPRQRLVPRGRRLGGSCELQRAARQVRQTAGSSLYPGTPTVTGTTEKNANWHDTQTFRARAQVAAGRRSGVDPVDLRADAAHQRHRRLLAQHLRTRPATTTTTATPSATRARPVVSRGDQGRLEPRRGRTSSRTPRISRATSIRSRTTRSGSIPCTSSTNTRRGRTRGLQVPLTSRITRTISTQEIRASSADSSSPLQWTPASSTRIPSRTRPNSSYDPSWATITAAPALPGNYVYMQPRFSMLDKQHAVFGEVSLKITDYLETYRRPALLATSSTPTSCRRSSRAHSAASSRQQHRDRASAGR